MEHVMISQQDLSKQQILEVARESKQLWKVKDQREFLRQKILPVSGLSLGKHKYNGYCTAVQQ